MRESKDRRTYEERVDALAKSYADIETRKSSVLLHELVGVAERSKPMPDAVQRAMVISVLGGELLRRAEAFEKFEKFGEQVKKTLDVGATN